MPPRAHVSAPRRRAGAGHTRRTPTRHPRRMMTKTKTTTVSSPRRLCTTPPPPPPLNVGCSRPGAVAGRRCTARGPSRRLRRWWRVSGTTAGASGRISSRWRATAWRRRSCRGPPWTSRISGATSSASPCSPCCTSDARRRRSRPRCSPRFGSSPRRKVRRVGAARRPGNPLRKPPRMEPPVPTLSPTDRKVCAGPSTTRRGP
mmetsp:Transcript_10393/g.47692  ORF Transcript_10393/g.47692 Transcript_10393/m.47692 type:complete len:203 (+) Transcript_10393:1217-1825(+)